MQPYLCCGPLFVGCGPPLPPPSLLRLLGGILGWTCSTIFILHHWRQEWTNTWNYQPRKAADQSVAPLKLHGWWCCNTCCNTCNPCKVSRDSWLQAFFCTILDLFITESTSIFLACIKVSQHAMCRTLNDSAGHRIRVNLSGLHHLLPAKLTLSGGTSQAKSSRPAESEPSTPAFSSRRGRIVLLREWQVVWGK